jgi:hypothetical protein
MQRRAHAIATAGRAPYLRRVSLTRLIRFLAMLAVVLSPLAMLVATPAHASFHHMVKTEHAAAPMAAGHCPDMDRQSKDRSAPSMDCAMACAAIPAVAGWVTAPPSAPSAADPIRLTIFGHGLEPEAATPPPRFA